MVRLDFPIPHLSGGCDAPEQPQTKKPAWSTTLRVSTTSAYSSTSPPGQAGLPFIQSSDDTSSMIPLEPSMSARHVFTIDYPARDKNSKRIVFLCSMLACKGKNMSSRIVRM